MPKQKRFTGRIIDMEAPWKKDGPLGGLAEGGPQRKQRDVIQGKKLDFASTLEVITEITSTAAKFPKSLEESQFLEETLKSNFLFSDLSGDEMDLLVGAMEKEEAAEGSLIIKQGDVGDFFYVVESGSVNFIIGDGQNVGSCARGGAFGELALLYDTPRAATCVAGIDSVLWKVDQKTFRSLQAGISQQGETKSMDLLKTIPLFEALDETKLLKFSDALTTVEFKKNDRIVTKGEVGDAFYIVNTGTIKVHDIGMGDSQSIDQILGTGGWFGERALLTGEPRAANITAISEKVTCQSIDRETFENVFGSFQEVIDHEMKKNFIKGLPIFAKSNLLKKERDDLVKCMKVLDFKKGEKIVEKGETTEPKLCIIQKGKVVVYEGDGKIYRLESGDYFGLKDESIEDQDTIVSEDTTKCWVLLKTDIERVLGDVKRLGSNAPFVSSKRNQSITQKDLQKHRVLGQGAYGLVWLVSQKKEEEKKTPYALKIVNKKLLVDSKQTNYIMSEKNLLSTLDHPFISGLISSFQDSNDLYLLMELIQGGELFDTVHAPANNGNGVSNEDAKFYSACVLDGLGHFHERYICYRDLKPENVLIDNQGYCMIVDLGFAKIVPNKTYSMVGTPEYLAPEIIMSKGHNKAVDYWALGVLIYEMLVGESPFYANTGGDQMTLFRNIVRGKYKFVDTPGKECNDEVKDLIKKLLTKKQTNRLGNLSGGHIDIENHEWYKSIDFEKLLKKEIQAPAVPSLKDPFSGKEKPTDVESSTTPNGLTEKDQAQFELF